MRKYILFLSFFLFSSDSFSQDIMHALRTGYGLSSTVANTPKLKKMLANSLKGQDYYMEQRSTGISFLSYHYDFESPFISMGITYAFEMRTGGVFKNDETTEETIIKTGTGDFTKAFHTVAAEVRYDYYQKKSFAIYALGGMGATFQKENYHPADSKATETGSSIFFNYQLTPIGIKYGDTFVVFGEVGFGYKGLFTMGVSFAF